jgi:amino acid transporter
VTASVGYGAATFLDLTLDTLSSSWASFSGLKTIFVLFVVIMVLAALANIFSSHLLAVINNISVWWHVAGAAIVVILLIVLPKTHQSLNFVFTERVNNSGFADGSTSGLTFWFLVMPLGLLLTQYTITGFDASAHLSEETQGAAEGAAKGIWRSIFYSAIGGYILLLAFVFAVQDPTKVTEGGGGIDVIFGQALPDWAHFLVLLISTAGQLFCATACLTSASRMTFAFSRDGAIPGSRWLSTVNKATKIPANAVIFVTVVGIVITLPALKSIGGVPVAFLAVVSVAVIGLYLAFAIPIFLRWRMGDAFEPGSWTLGSKYKWMNLIAVAEIVIISIYFILPFTPAGVPFTKDFAWESVNYAPVLTFGVLIVLAIWWTVSAKKWFTGPKHTIDDAVVNAFEE